ncbi:MAG: hypothetical protein M5U01_01085 [Ardenticatenaceae bacterium]|nr:hypothetical protein [Ardenticatenaceae bacterium]
MSGSAEGRALLALAAAVLCVYLMTFSGRFHSIDEISTLATTESLVKHGDLAVEQVRWSATWTPPQNREGADGRYYSKKGVAVALLAAPLYALALRWPGLGLVQAAMVTAVILSAGSAALLAAILRRLGYGLRPALGVAAIFALATPAWPYSRLLYAEPPTTFLWLLALWALLASRDGPAWAVLAGSALGASVLVKTPNLVGVAVYVAVAVGLWLYGFGGRRGDLTPRLSPLPPKGEALASDAHRLGRSGQRITSGSSLLTLRRGRGRSTRNLTSSPEEGKSFEDDVAYPDRSSSGQQSPPSLLPTLGRRRRRGPSLEPMIALAVPLLLFAALFLVLNWLRFGSLLATGYGDADERFVFDYAVSLPALLLSPGKGLFVFAPPLLAALAGWRRFWRRQRRVALLVVALALANLLLYGAWFMWWGGWSWGPRFLLPLVPFLLLPLAEMLASPNRLVLVATGLSVAAGVAINLMGTVVDFNEYLAALIQRGIDDRATIWSPILWPPAGHLALLRAGPPDVAWLVPGLTWVPLLLAALAAASVLALRRGLRVGERTRGEDGGIGSGRIDALCSLHSPLSALLVAMIALIAVLVALPRAAAGADDETLRALSQTIAANAGADDAVLIDLVPYQDYFGFIQRWMNHYKARPSYTALVRGEAGEHSLQRLNEHPRLWLVLPQTAPADPASSTERWWAERAAFLDERWVGGVRVVRFARVPDGSGVGLGPVHVLGDRVELLAPGLAPSDGLMVVTLPWRALRPLDRELRVFVQVLGPNGQVVSQQDRAPVSGFAPTTAWLPGEVVLDRYALPLPREGGPLRLIAGLYDPATGARLPVTGGTDFVDLGQLGPE